MNKVVLSTLMLFLTLAIQSHANTSIKVKELQKEFIENVIIANKYKIRFRTYLSSLCGDINQNDKCVNSKISFIKNWRSTKKDRVLNGALKRKIQKLSLNKSKFKKNILEIDQKYWNKIKRKLERELKYTKLNKSQFVSIIDLAKQKIIIALYDYTYNDFLPVGVDLVSSGDMDREESIAYGEDHYFDSPKGIFKIKGGWRSDGERNEDGSFGYGAKDRYIFYLGRQKSVRYNTFDRKGNKIQDKSKWKLISDKMDFAMHAHQSGMPFGKAYSHGCIRITNELNKFLDSNLILHKNNINPNDLSWKQKYVSAPSDAKNHSFAGEYVIIMDKI